MNGGYDAIRPVHPTNDNDTVGGASLRLSFPLSVGSWQGDHLFLSISSWLWKSHNAFEEAVGNGDITFNYLGLHCSNMTSIASWKSFLLSTIYDFQRPRIGPSSPGRNSELKLFLGGVLKLSTLLLFLQKMAFGGLLSSPNRPLGSGHQRLSWAEGGFDTIGALELLGTIWMWHRIQFLEGCCFGLTKFSFPLLAHATTWDKSYPPEGQCVMWRLSLETTPTLDCISLRVVWILRPSLGLLAMPMLNC
ncbi:hypothetical protein Tco_1086756 [Tanacetum coccineum]